jgi:hypothetical protein
MKMNSHLPKLMLLLSAVVLVAGLGFTQASEKATAFPCDPNYVKRDGNVFTVYPSGGDETTNLACAFESAKAAGLGSTVRLVEGNYRMYMLEVSGFYGSFEGAGIGKTVLLPQHHMDCQLKQEEEKVTSLITFRLGDARISNLTFFIDDPEPCAAQTWAAWGDGHRHSLESALLFTGSPIVPEDPCNHLVSEEASGSVDRVEFLTPPDAVGNSGYYVLRPLYINPGLVFADVNSNCFFWTDFLYGRYSITNSVFTTHNIDITSFLTGGRLTISNNTFTGSLIGIESEDVQGTNVIIQDNVFTGAEGTSIGAWSNQWEAWDTQPNFTIPVTYTIDHNTFYQSGGWAIIDMVGYANLNYGEHRTQANISNNHLIMDGEWLLGINVEGVKDVQITNNTVEGTGDAGILLNGWGYLGGWSAPLVNGKVAANNLSKFELYDPASSLAPILLGPETSSCLVVGASQTDSVLDAGTNNRVVAIKLAKKSDHPALEKAWQQMRR